MVKAISATSLVVALTLMGFVTLASGAPQLTFTMRPMRPFIACRGCENFMQCFMMCPFKEYPGMNSDGVYDPNMLRTKVKKSIKKMTSVVPQSLRPSPPRPQEERKRPRRNNTSRVRLFMDKMKKGAMDGARDMIFETSEMMTKPITQPLAAVTQLTSEQF